MNLLDGDLDVLLARLVLGQQTQVVGWGARKAQHWVVLSLIWAAPLRYVRLRTDGPPRNRKNVFGSPSKTGGLRS